LNTKCEICGTETNNQVSYLELDTWEFNSLNKEAKDCYPICFDYLELRKKRSQMVNKEVETEIEAILEAEN
jgi:hypothetical protein